MTEGSDALAGRSGEEYEQMLEAKLRPASIRLTLSFAGLYQMTHEMLKHAILTKVHEFYCSGFDQNGLTFDEAAYKENVIDVALAEGQIKHGKQKFDASAAWLMRMEAITDEQNRRLRDIYSHRHEVTHELMSFIVDPDRNVDMRMFVDALAILRDVHRFWVMVEADIGTFDHLGDVSLDAITPASLALLQLCIDAFLEDEEN